MGQAVGIVDLTQGELGTRGTPEQRLVEADDAAKTMGVSIRENAGMADGFFRNDKEHQLLLVKYIRRYQPDIVLANTLSDRHPDHGRGGRLIADACFLAGLRKVETEWEGEPQTAWRPKRIFHFQQDRNVPPAFIVDISSTFEKKMEAIKCYKTQFHDPNSTEPITYISTGDFLNQLTYRDAQVGKQIGVAYGEAFHCENVPGISDLDQLLLPEIP